MNIVDHNGKVYFPEVMMALFHSVIGINDDKVMQCIQVKTVIKMFLKKYKDLPKNSTLDTLCGNVYHKNNYTVY
jgi:hypothetical protein